MLIGLWETAISNIVGSGLVTSNNTFKIKKPHGGLP